MFREAEPLRDRLVAGAACEFFEDVAFARRQPFGRGAGGRIRRRSEHEETAQHGGRRRVEIRTRSAARQHAARAGAKQRAGEIAVRLVHER